MGRENRDEGWGQDCSTLEAKGEGPSQVWPGGSKANKKSGKSELEVSRGGDSRGEGDITWFRCRNQVHRGWCVCFQP